MYCREICLRPSSFEPTSVQEHTRYERLYKPKRITSTVNLKKKVLHYYTSIASFYFMQQKLLTSTSIYIYIYIEREREREREREEYCVFIFPLYTARHAEVERDRKKQRNCTFIPTSLFRDYSLIRRFLLKTSFMT